MNLINRNINAIDGKEDLEVLHSIKDFPVFMGCVNHSEDDDLLAEMTWSISPNNGVLQLCKLIPLNILYREQHDSGQIGKTWMNHHCEFARFIKGEPPKAVLEIGGGHGTLSREYEKIDEIKWTIIEPNPAPLEGVNARYIKGFLDKDFKLDTSIDTVINSHVLEHIYDPNEFIKHISSLIKEGQKLIFSIPNMEEMLKAKFTNCLNFEHTILLTEPYVEHILSKHGFKKLTKQYFLKNHSIFYSYEKDKDTELIDLPKDLYIHNKKLYLDYIEFHERLIHDLNKKISNVKTEQSIYLFGAHVFAQYLIAIGLNTERILCVLDNDQNKHHKRLYGTSLTASSPKILSDVKNPIVILKAGAYNDEIKDDILSNINKDTIFWETGF